MQAGADGEGGEIARAGAAERDRARGDRLGEWVGLRFDPGQTGRRVRHRPRIRRGGRFEHGAPPSVPDVDGTPGAGRRAVRRIRTEGARGVCSRGTTLLARRPGPPGGAHLSVVRSVGTTHLSLLVARGDVLRPAARGRVRGDSASPRLPPSLSRLRGCRPYSSPSSRGTTWRTLHVACRWSRYGYCI